MIFLQRSPGHLLRPWIRALWYCRAPRRARQRERVLPNGCIQIVINLSRDFLTDCGEDGAATLRLPRSIIVGARTRYGVVDTADMDELAGIVVRPGGFAGLFRSVPTCSLSDQSTWSRCGRARALRKGWARLPRLPIS